MNLDLHRALSPPGRAGRGTQPFAPRGAQDKPRQAPGFVVTRMAPPASLWDAFGSAFKTVHQQGFQPRIDTDTVDAATLRRGPHTAGVPPPNRLCELRTLHSSLSLRADKRQVCPCIVAIQLVSHTCASPGASLDHRPSVLPTFSVVDGMRRQSAPLHNLACAHPCGFSADRDSKASRVLIVCFITA